MLLSGIIGLFIGAMMLALGYKLFQAWLATDLLPETDQGAPTGTIPSGNGQPQKIN